MNEDKGTRYHRLQRRAGMLSLAWSAALLVWLQWSGVSIELRDAVAALAAGLPAGPRESAVVLLYVAGLILMSEAGALPIAFYGGFVVERRYGLSRQPGGAWLRDQAKSLALAFLVGGAAAVVLYAIVRREPEGWWLAAGVAFAAAVIGLTILAPVLLLPLFYRVRPLARASLRERLLRLARQADAPVLGVYEWGVGEKSRKANAALAGLGSTRRILVSDTMLTEYSDDEIEVVFAHELGHHVHGDIWRAIALESGVIIGGLFCASLVLKRLVGPFGLSGPADVAGLPVVLLAAGAVSVVLLPAIHALSRANERRADRFALRLTGNAPAFISAMRRLGAQNLAEEQPSRLVQWLFYSHPPLRERIAEAQRFKATAAGDVTAASAGGIAPSR